MKNDFYGEPIGLKEELAYQKVKNTLRSRYIDAKQRIYFSNGVDKVTKWDQPKYFGFIPKPRYINVYSRRLAKEMEKFFNKYF